MASKRQDILDAALFLFAEKGFHGTAMPDLAARASVGTGTIYRHFESKEAIVNALYQFWKGTLAVEVYQDLDPSLPWRVRFGQLWRRLFAFNKAHPGAIAFLDLTHHGDYLDQTSRMVEMAAAADFFEMVLDAQAQQLIVDMPPAAIVAMVYGAFLGLVRAELEEFIELDDAFVAQAEERAWALIRR